MRRPNVFSGPYADRVAHLRKDAAAVDALMAAPGTRVLAVREARNLVRRTPDGWVAETLGATAAVAFAPPADWILLGVFRGEAHFVCEVAHERPVGDPAVTFEELRRTGGGLPDDEAGLLAYARALVLWRARTRHCGVCGAPNRPTSAGHVMTCTREGCGAEHFPRIDPAIIVLVTDGEHALLGRQAAWPEGRYSTIAGFVEPGESLEDAVAREVLEEAGVTVLASEYHSSQPWPFPSSLMIGYTATAAPGQVPRADEELEDVRWFSRADIAAGAVGLPFAQSVSYRLIEDWYDSGSPRSLRDTPGVRSWGRGER
ncbi:MAG: NAD(+) diphosphatase [Steroidobacteraceae bacterium]